MSIEIVARFENIDFAESALVRLGELGIEPQAYRMRSVHQNQHNHIMPLIGSVNESMPILTNSIPLAGYSSHIEDNDSKEKKEDVVLHLLVDDNSKEQTESALISTHALNVRPL